MIMMVQETQSDIALRMVTACRRFITGERNDDMKRDDAQIIKMVHMTCKGPVPMMLMMCKRVNAEQLDVAMDMDSAPAVMTKRRTYEYRQRADDNDETRA